MPDFISPTAKYLQDFECHTGLPISSPVSTGKAVVYGKFSIQILSHSKVCSYVQVYEYKEALDKQVICFYRRLVVTSSLWCTCLCV